MKKQLKKVIKCLAIGAVSILPFVALAESEINPRYEDMQLARRPYNLKLGNLSLDLAYQFSGGYDSNINVTDSTNDRENGCFIKNGLVLGVYWPVLPRTLEIDTSISLGYKSYHGADGNDGFYINTRVGDTDMFRIDYRISKTKILSFTDSIAFNMDTIEWAGATSAELVTFTNHAAFQFEAKNRSNSYSARVGRIDTKTSGDKVFEYRDNVLHYIALDYYQEISKSIIAGPYASYRTTEYDNSINNDAENIEFGLQSRIKLSSRTRLHLALGYEFMQMDDNNNIVGDGDGDGFTGLVSITNEISKSLSQKVYARYKRTLGYSARVDYSEDILAGYEFKYQMWSALSARFNFTYLHSKDIAPSVTGFDGLTETFEPSVQFDYKFGRRCRAYLKYNRRINDTKYDAVARDYKRDRYTLGVSYDF